MEECSDRDRRRKGRKECVKRERKGQTEVKGKETLEAGGEGEMGR